MSTKDEIKWSECIGHTVKFIYNDIEGYVTITGYNNKTRKLTITYSDYEPYEIHTSNFRNCTLKMLFCNKLKIGDRFVNDKKDVVITDIYKTNNRTFVTYHCNRCKGNHSMVRYDFLSTKIGCAICSNKVIVKGINDIATTHPFLALFFSNKEDTYKYAVNSHKKVEMKCIDCGYKKTMRPNDLYNQGFSCNKCGDGISYPEKVITNVLSQLVGNDNFEVQKSFDWLKDKIYDYYIHHLNTIIEVHGLQHYEEGFIGCGGRTLEYELENDKLKYKLAKKNNIQNYIVIDARYSNLEYIKQSVFNSDLNKLFDLNSLDWYDIQSHCLTSLVKDACKLKSDNPLMPVTEIANILKLNRNTITSYLKKGAKLGWCKYDEEEIRLVRQQQVYDRCNKKIEVYTDECNVAIYESLSELCRQSIDIFGTQFSPSAVSRVCNGKLISHKGYKFRYL